MNRDDFTKITKDILAKRVGFLCSNPKCKKHTIGPNSAENKVTLTGIAAHITAAAPGGPRYDATLSPELRRHISNGVWLCSNCSILIDRDENAFPVQILLEWKRQAELKMQRAIAGEVIAHSSSSPFIEADLIWSSGSKGRWNRGFSTKNIEIYGNEIQAGSPLVAFWEVDWRFSFVLHNNSKIHAYNVKVEQIANAVLSSITAIPKINNLPPFNNFDLQAKTQVFFEGFHYEADALINEKTPKHIEGLELRITYLDEERFEHETLVRIEGGEVINQKIK